MSLDKVNQIRDRVKNKNSVLSSVDILVDCARELGCLSDIIGREYEITDNAGNIIARIHQKPMKLLQLNTILKSLDKLHKKEKEAMEKGRRKK